LLSTADCKEHKQALMVANNAEEEEQSLKNTVFLHLPIHTVNLSSIKDMTGHERRRQVTW